MPDFLFLCAYNYLMTLIYRIQINQFQPSVTFRIETSHLICTANQMTGFYMKCNTGLKWVKYGKVLNLWEPPVSIPPVKKTLREKCLYSEFFWSIFSCIWSKYGEILRTPPHSVQMREIQTRKTPNTDNFHEVKAERAFVSQQIY